MKKKHINYKCYTTDNVIELDKDTTHCRDREEGKLRSRDCCDLASSASSAGTSARWKVVA
ncbi:hypothetical protein SESBI_24628 [Sesbania bispinosa]|nr:hypothetical protein SESBI_24628 [Sesbania bispinosa]